MYNRSKQINILPCTHSTLPQSIKFTSIGTELRCIIHDKFEGKQFSPIKSCMILYKTRIEFQIKLWKYVNIVLILKNFDLRYCIVWIKCNMHTYFIDVDFFYVNKIKVIKFSAEFMYVINTLLVVIAGLCISIFYHLSLEQRYSGIKRDKMWV